MLIKGIGNRWTGGWKTHTFQNSVKNVFTWNLLINQLWSIIMFNTDVEDT